jgi:hypothetical protein
VSDMPKRGTLTLLPGGALRAGPLQYDAADHRRRRDRPRAQASMATPACCLTTRPGSVDLRSGTRGGSGSQSAVTRLVPKRPARG